MFKFVFREYPRVMKRYVFLLLIISLLFCSTESLYAEQKNEKLTSNIESPILGIGVGKIIVIPNNLDGVMRVALYQNAIGEKLKSTFKLHKITNRDNFARLRLCEPFYHYTLPEEVKEWTFVESCVASDIPLLSRVEKVGSVYKKNFRSDKELHHSMDFLWRIQLSFRESEETLMDVIRCIPFFEDSNAYYFLTYQKNYNNNQILYKMNKQGQLFLTCKEEIFLSTPALLLPLTKNWYCELNNDEVYASFSNSTYDVNVKIKLKWKDRHNNEWILSWKKIPKENTFQEILIHEL